MRKYISVTLFIQLIFTCAEVYGQNCADTTNIYQIKFKGKKYEVVKEYKNWANAAACAVERGGYLIEINDSIEQDSIFDAILNKAGVSSTYTSVSGAGNIAYVWIGATDKNEADQWIWDGNNDGNGMNFWNGSAVPGPPLPISGIFVNWGGTSQGVWQEPGPGGQDVAAMALTGWPSGTNNVGIAGEWNDIDTSASIFYIIEYDSTATDGLSQELNKDSHITVYPNPTGNVLNIRSDNPNRFISYLTITSQLGTQIYQRKIAQSLSVTIKLAGIESGLYVVNITFDNGDTIKREFIVE